MSAVIYEDLVSIERAIPMRRVWAMPSSCTFDIPPIRALVKKYLYQSKVSVDPFARNKRWATYTNDLNPETAADSHLPAVDFLSQILSQGVEADLGLFDPPYNVSQAKEMYQSIGIDKLPQAIASSWAAERNALCRVIAPNGFVISCNWNSNGMGDRARVSTGGTADCRARSRTQRHYRNSGAQDRKQAGRTIPSF